MKTNKELNELIYRDSLLPSQRFALAELFLRAERADELEDALLCEQNDKKRLQSIIDKPPEVGWLAQFLYDNTPNLNRERCFEIATKIFNRLHAEKGKDGE